MERNRSVPVPASVMVPVLTYPDVRAAVAWLVAVFGAAERVKIGGDIARVRRASG